MIYWSIQTLILSIVLILLVHHLILFFKDTLTIPKIKDLVNTTDDKYENMYKIISRSNEQGIKEKSPLDSTTLLSLLPNGKEETPTKESVDIESMKNELRSFLKKNMQQATDSYGSSSSSFSIQSFLFCGYRPFCRYLKVNRHLSLFPSIVLTLFFLV